VSNLATGAKRSFDWLRSRLVVRIYLIGLAQFVLVAIGIVVAAREGRPVGPSVETLSVVAESIAESPDDARTVAIALASAEKLLHTSLAVYDERHRLVAGTPGPAATPPPPPESMPGPPPPWAAGPHPPHGVVMSVPVALRDGRVWHLVAAARPPSLLAGIGTVVVLILLVAGVSAWLTARSLARPLARLSAAAQAFGSGNIGARADFARRDELGEVAAAFNQMADRVTDALRAERELLANISHELRTPLQRIRIATDLAAEGDAVTVHESLAEIAEDLAELERLVGDVLSAARLSIHASGSNALPPIHTSEVDFAALLHKSESRFRSLYPGRPLVVDVGPDLPRLEVDTALMHRAIDNLLDNAHKYTEDPARPVELAAWRREDAVVVEVRDRGIGIEAADIARLFEPFFRADRSRNRGSGGLGLGLALARRILAAHGGTLTVKSVVGEGTTARIELPSRHAAHT